MLVLYHGRAQGFKAKAKDVSCRALALRLLYTVPVVLFASPSILVCAHVYGPCHVARMQWDSNSALCSSSSSLRIRTRAQFAAAGFVHTPNPDYWDMVTCISCDKALDSWDANDDPMCVIL